MRTITSIDESRWEGDFLVATATDDQGNKETLRFSLPARSEIATQSLTNTVDTPQISRVSLKTIGVGSVPAIAGLGNVLVFVLPGKRAIQLLIPPDGLAVLQAKVAAMKNEPPPKTH